LSRATTTPRDAAVTAEARRTAMARRRSTIAIWILSLALVVSNLWWLYAALDAAVTAMYLEQTFDEHRQALTELLAVVPVAADPAATRESVLGAAHAAATHDVSFEKEGFFWIGQLGYRFDDAGRLVEVRTSWSPF
jgi:hypothetical protein